MATATTAQKDSHLRHAEYYDLTEVFDDLYARSKAQAVFTDLMPLILSEENIRLAYRNIKRNTGSRTAGVDHLTMKHIEKLTSEEVVSKVRHKLAWYKPKPVRRVEIPKPNGKTRPLGIPAIWDRLVQQCILQVLEPICEAKFHDRSNGFRPNRSTEHAIAQSMRMVQIQHLYFVVDVDIKGFFDNVNHAKLMRQMWTLGIQDKRLLCIIKEMLKAPIVLPSGEKIYPDKGTPQGGILSPLLSNIVLNELDWWVSSQWEDIPTHTVIKEGTAKNGTPNRSNKCRTLRRSNLKEMYIVRYADDFRIFCRKRSDATASISGRLTGTAMPPDGLPAMRSSKVRCTQKISKKKEVRLMMLRKPTCADCPHNLQYMERLPIKKKGVTMHLGERFCVAGKRARKFKRSDPKTYVPSWCPRLKAPCELRIYGFKNQREWRMHRSMCAYLGEDTSPSAFRYAVRYEGHTDLAPYEFFECCNEKSDDEILGAAVQHYDVVEIDDGIKPAFFYKTEHGYELLFSFDAKTAKKNIREEID